ncbi:ABC transporter substrate-binding protein [Microbacterium sp. NPDC096154]|uniref:ABC transporter substrate-binding protein n=1 Tax=Microbacterium sp. NPDC096154 TaxID=3155549 RepID=UPI0033310E52
MIAPRRVDRTIARCGAVAALAAILVLAGCAPALPKTVVSGTEVTVAWDAGVASLNPGSVTGATPGGLDVAELTRGEFADIDGDEVVPDPSFGTVTLLDDEGLTVRYDLASPTWSDGIPVDAADLLLGWAAASNFHGPDGFDPLAVRGEDGTLDLPEGVAWFDSVRSGLTGSADVPRVDEFARSIEVELAAPVRDWQTALDVAVPAHVIAATALGLDDPMEAKQAVSEAVLDGDGEALAAIARAWNGALTLTPGEDPDSSQLISSGPYRIADLAWEQGGQRIEFVANGAYAGEPTPTYERVVLSPAGDDPAAGIGAAFDIAQVAPTGANRRTVRDLERTDHPVTAAHDGTMWVLLLKPRGVFGPAAARLAFLHAIPKADVVEAAAGEWKEHYSSTDAMLFAPSERGYEIAMEDAGFRDTIGHPTGRAADERSAAGVPAGARVCVLYDKLSEFAVRAFAALRDGTAEAGWTVADCGAEDAAPASPGWDAAILRVPIPRDAAEIGAQWGAGSPGALAGDGSAERDALIAQYAHTADAYAARDVRVQIEASIVTSAVALPLAVNPRVTLVDKDVTGVVARPGASASVTWGAAAWSPSQD